ncbi:MAG TPA: DUF1573 domain-containing protein [Allocoleopsis sp.]
MLKSTLSLIILLGFQYFLLAQEQQPSMFSNAIQIVVTPKAVPESADNMLIFDKKAVDFGKLMQGDTRSITFEFKNVGEEPLKIDSVSSFPFLKIEYSKTSIPVQEKGFIKVMFLSEKLTKESINRLFEKDLDVLFKNIDKTTGVALSSKLNIKAFVSELGN